MSRRSEKVVLLNPGPVNTSDRVKSALVQDDMSHRDPEYAAGLVRLTDKLREIFRGGTEHAVLLVTGSGTAASESVISSCVPADKKLLVLQNGAFGARLGEIAELHGIVTERLCVDAGQTIVVGDVAKKLEEDPDIAAVVMCHHETSVGLLNPVRQIGAVCQKMDRLFLVDAVSSLGAEDLDVVRDHIDVCWASANKCLHAISGVGFVCVHRRVWPRIANIKPRTFYLDLNRYHKAAADRGQTPFTPAVQNFYALEAACDEYIEDGPAQRYAMYAARNVRLRQGLSRLGLSFFTDTGHESHTILTPTLPEGLGFDELAARLKESGFVVYDTKPPMLGKYFQVANMGEVSDVSLDLFLAEMARICAA